MKYLGINLAQFVQSSYTEKLVYLQNIAERNYKRLK